ncbi:pyridoxal 5'-phosphate synthase glutaminase subunit PdxT [Clostridium sp.]|uniref:pyridoxal 5'-phosphate synthase glutaminase subunit PdxT n=1 Tax=Clostridium sp. TaxID=1506 RepID=UPI00321661F1
MITIGVLDLQGAVIEHINKINEIEGVSALKVKNLEDLSKVQGIILPGGESTVIGKLLRDLNILDTLREKIKEGLPVWGTCAGMILLAKKIEGYDYNHIGTMDIEVKRNAYGAQVDSFITEEIIEGVSNEKIPMIFIRAPYVERVLGDVEVLCKVKGNIVACREKNMLATSFHPELSKDLTMHRYFHKMCSQHMESNLTL